MDIKAIMNAPAPPPPKPADVHPKLESNQFPHYPPQSFREHYHPPHPGQDHGRDIRPLQPPPLQAPAQNDLRSPSSASYQSNPSPYQQTPPSAHGNGQYPFPRNVPQSPSRSGPGGPQYPQRDSPMAPMHTGYPHSFEHPTSISRTPTATTPGSAQTYFAHARPQSSHSITTPTSAQPYTTQFPHQSPSASQPPTRPQSQSFPTQQYVSQPSTPLGPPPTFSKGISSVRKESPGSYGHTRNLSGGSYGHPPISSQSPASDHPGSYHASPMNYHSRPPALNHSDHSVSAERDRSVSVSPKTRLQSQPMLDVSQTMEQPALSYGAQFSSSNVRPNHGRPEAYHETERVLSQGPSRSISLGMEEILNSPTKNESSGQRKEPAQHSRKMLPQDNVPPSAPIHSFDQPGSSHAGDLSTTAISSVHEPARQSSAPSDHSPSQTHQSHTNPLSKGSDHSHMASLPPHPSEQSSPQPAPPVSDHGVGADIMPPKPPKVDPIPPPIDDVKQPEPPKATKRRREEPPIWAQSSRRGGRGNPFLKKNKLPPGRLGPDSAEDSTAASSAKNRQQLRNTAETNGHPIAGSEGRLPQTHPDTMGEGLLGPLEANIANRLPNDEIVVLISDWLYEEVVVKHDVGVAPAGGAKVEGAVFEIEAKIGQLIDTNKDTRLSLPCLTECVLDKSLPDLRINFRSSMNVKQHSQLNQYLNKLFADSKEPPRTPVSYVHTYEVDTFYELSQNGILALPAAIRQRINPRNPKTMPKMRITKDQKTGEEIDKIIKAHIDDLEVYSPRAPFDWRLSVNIEMRVTGDATEMINLDSAKRKSSDRSKNRVTYRHQAYQVDLTQVSMPEIANKTHELEIEIASEEVRRQGLLASQGKPNQYPDLIKSFVDNVRLLTRHLPQQSNCW